MVNTYSTCPESRPFGAADNNVRRRAGNPVSSIPSRSQPTSNGSLSDKGADVNQKQATPTRGRGGGDLQSEILAAPRTPKRKLPWLDGKPPSAKAAISKGSRIPGAYTSESDRSSTPSIKPPPSPQKFAIQTVQRVFPLAPNGPPNPINATSYSPSNYSIPPPSIRSIDEPVKEPKSQTSYEALVPPRHRLDRTSQYTESKKSEAIPESHDEDEWTRDYTAVLPSKQEPVIVYPVQTTTSMQAQSADISPHDVSNHRPPPEHGLTRAISGLENLMQEAIQVAKDAADHGKPEEASNVMKGAATALRKTSTIKTYMEPLVVSEESSPVSPRATIHPPVAEPTKTSGLGNAFLRRISTKRAQPPHLQQTATAKVPVITEKHQRPQHTEPIAVDWAYAKRENQSSSSSSEDSTDTSDVEMGRQNSTHWRAWHNNVLRPVYHDDPRPNPDPYQYLRHRPPRNVMPVVPPMQSSGDGSLRHRPRHRSVSRSRIRRSSRGNEDRHKPRSDRIDIPGPYERLDEKDHVDQIAVIPMRLHAEGPSGHHLRFIGPSRRKRQPIARNWGRLRKRICAAVACINTGLVGFLIGVYAGEVPRIQYFIADQHHKVILGNVVLYLGLGVSTFLFWPLPLLHGRKPYTLGALALLLPLQFPQALVSDRQRAPTAAIRVGLLLPRAISGLALGFANVNFVTTLLDLFGASLQSENPHQELVVVSDVRRHGGGMGLWLGIWTWSFIASIAIGFLTGAGIINDLNPAWGFYITVIMIAFVLVLNVMTPETRRSRHRSAVLDVVDANDNVYQRVARGEIKLHISTEGPEWWWEEVMAGITLSYRMVTSRGFALMSVYLGWIYAEVVLIIVLLGALLSREYRWQPREVGGGVVAIAIGALFAVPLTKAGLFSRDRKQGPRTDSMTFQSQFSWTSHMVRRIVFTVTLPLAGLAYTLASPGIKVHFMVPIFFAAFVGFLSNLAIAECIGLIMETYDTSDLQPGVNTKHRLQSMAEVDRRRRTTYSSFPRVSAGIFVSQTLAFFLAAAATGVGGIMSRSLSAQKATAITAGVLFVFTLMFTGVLWRFKSLQVIPDGAMGTRSNTADWGEAMAQDKEWKPVIIGNPSGKMRRMNALEMGKESRWTEIRRLNKLIRK